MTARLVLFVPRHADVSAPWRLVSGAGQILQRGMIDADQTLPFDHPVTAVVPGTEVAVRWFELPRGGAAQLATAARWEMAEHLGHDLDGDVVSVGARSTGGLVPVAAVARPLLETWRNWIDGLNAEQVRIIPDQLCLLAAGELTLKAMLPDGNLVLAGQGMNLTVSPDLADALADDARSVKIDDADVLDRLAVGSLSAPVDLAASGPVPARRSWRRASVLAALVIISPLILIGAEIVRDSLRTRGYQKEARAQAVAFMADAANAPDPLARVEQALDQMPTKGGQVGLLSRMTTAMEKVPGTHLAEVDGAGRQIRGLMVLPSAEAVEELRDALAGQALSLQRCDLSQEDGQTLCAFEIEGVA